ncbi:hypothetical protein AAE478_010389 [Parahypoxylon ruwenzoriense]
MALAELWMKIINLLKSDPANGLSEETQLSNGEGKDGSDSGNKSLRGSVAIHLGDHNKTVQTGSGNTNQINGHENNTLQEGYANSNSILNGYNDTAQWGDENVSNTNGNKNTMRQFGNKNRIETRTDRATTSQAGHNHSANPTQPGENTEREPENPPHTYDRLEELWNRASDFFERKSAPPQPRGT